MALLSLYGLSSQMPKIVFYINVTLLLRSGSNVGGQGQRSGQGHGSRSKVEIKFWRIAVNIRGSALPSAAKSKNHRYQSKMIVCVSVISRRMRIIVRMRSIGF